MLPPSMFGGDGFGSDDFRDDHSDIYDALDDAGIDASDFDARMEAYAEGSGFSAEQWVGMMTDIRDVRYDDDGNVHFTFDFDMETDGGEYAGTRSM